MFDVFMRYPGWKPKAVTFSYDDGVHQDRRLIDIFNKYGLKATFNINGGLTAPEGTVFPKGQIHRRFTKSEIRDLYFSSGHEIACHSLKHKFMDRLSDVGMISEIVADRMCLEKLTGRIIRGFAYPYGRYSERTEAALKACGILYARTATGGHSVAVPENLLKINPTCHHSDEMLDYFINKFQTKSPLDESHDRNPWLLYIWGHAFEFESDNSWDKIEKIASDISGRDDIWYCTNDEVFGYIHDFRQLVYSADGGLVFNPTSRDLYLEANDGKNVCIKPNETVELSELSIGEFVVTEK